MKINGSEVVRVVSSSSLDLWSICQTQDGKVWLDLNPCDDGSKVCLMGEAFVEDSDEHLMKMCNVNRTV